MAGTVSSKNAENDHLKTYISNLKKASDVLSSNNLTGIIEPINGYVIPGYFLNSFTKGNIIFNNRVHVISPTIFNYSITSFEGNSS